MTPTLDQYAIAYATELGWPIFPAHPRTKRPLIKTGADHAANASRDPEQLGRWFGRPWRTRDGEEIVPALAIPTGAASGVVVIDADAKHDGERVLAELEARYGALPRTSVVRTQSGGIHVYLAHPGLGVRVKTCVGGESSPWRERGVDVRADGGIVLLPPSVGYTWERGDVGFRLLPDGWLAVLTGAPSRRREPVELPAIEFTGEIDEADIESLRSLRRSYRTSKRDGDDFRGELLDRLLTGKALGQPGGRDDAVTRCGYIIGLTLPEIGPEAAAFIATKSLLAIPVPHGDREDHAHWVRKFCTSYERGSVDRRSHDERDRLLWQSVADAHAKGPRHE